MWVIGTVGPRGGSRGSLEGKGRDRNLCWPSALPKRASLAVSWEGDTETSLPRSLDLLGLFNFLIRNYCTRLQSRDSPVMWELCFSPSWGWAGNRPEHVHQALGSMIAGTSIWVPSCPSHLASFCLQVTTLV